MLPWDPDGLRQRCASLRATAEAYVLATKEELDSLFPGGTHNYVGPEEPLGQWIYCYGQLCRILDRRAQRETDNEDTQRRLARVLHGEPRRVDLIQPLEDGTAVLFVHPKSYAALSVLAELDRRHRECRAWRARLATLDEGTEPPADLSKARELITSTLSRLNATFIWIVTHPGTGLPYGEAWMMPWDHPDLPPAWCFAIAPADHLRVAQVYTMVNVGALKLLPRLDGDGGTVGWATFFTSLADQYHAPVDDLVSARPLAALITQSVLAADTLRRQRRMLAAKNAPPAPRGVVTL